MQEVSAKAIRWTPGTAGAMCARRRQRRGPTDCTVAEFRWSRCRPSRPPRSDHRRWAGSSGASWSSASDTRLPSVRKQHRKCRPRRPCRSASATRRSSSPGSGGRRGFGRSPGLAIRVGSNITATVWTSVFITAWCSRPAGIQPPAAEGVGSARHRSRPRPRRAGRIRSGVPVEVPAGDQCVAPDRGSCPERTTALAQCDQGPGISGPIQSSPCPKVQRRSRDYTGTTGNHERRRSDSGVHRRPRVEPPDMFLNHVPAKYKPEALIVVTDDKGVDQWMYQAGPGRPASMPSSRGRLRNGAAIRPVSPRCVRASMTCTSGSAI